MQSIVVVGSLNMDVVIKVPHIPKVGETILTDSIQQYAGGKGANQAVAAARLGGKVNMIGRIGKDKYGEALLRNLKANNVGITGVEYDEDDTGSAFIKVDEKGDNNIVVYPGANNNVTIEQIERHRDIIEKSDICIVQLEIPYEVVKYVVDVCYKSNIKVIFNPAPAGEFIEDYVLKKTFILIPNELELATISGKEINTNDELKTLANKLCNKGCKNVIVTLGDKGSLLVREDMKKYFESVKVMAKDTTGAGDSFIGGLAVALTEGNSIEEAIRFATNVAALTVTRSGAQSSLPKREEVQMFIKKEFKIEP